jgi:hypothetical protein
MKIHKPSGNPAVMTVGGCEFLPKSPVLDLNHAPRTQFSASLKNKTEKEEFRSNFCCRAFPRILQCDFCPKFFQIKKEKRVILVFVAEIFELSKYFNFWQNVSLTFEKSAE